MKLETHLPSKSSAFEEPGVGMRMYVLRAIGGHKRALFGGDSGSPRQTVPLPESSPVPSINLASLHSLGN